MRALLILSGMAGLAAVAACHDADDTPMYNNAVVVVPPADENVVTDEDVGKCGAGSTYDKERGRCTEQN